AALRIRPEPRARARRRPPPAPPRSTPTARGRRSARKPWARLRPGVRRRPRRPGCRLWPLLLAHAATRAVCFLHDLREVGFRLFLIHRECVHQLGREDLAGADVHLLLAGRETLLELADREVAHDLGQLVDVARLDLLAVVLEAAVPV